MMSRLISSLRRWHLSYFIQTNLVNFHEDIEKLVDVCIGAVPVAASR